MDVQHIEHAKHFEDKMREVDHRLWQWVMDLVEACEAQLGREDKELR